MDFKLERLTVNNMSVPQTNIESADIKLANLLIWIHGYEFPDAKDYWDGNWLRATAQCFDIGARVEVTGAFLHIPELMGWVKACEKLHVSLQGNADLECMEPELDVRLHAEKSGKILMAVKTTPNSLKQNHSFNFEIDQSYLPDFLAGCRNVFQRFPLKEAEKQID